MKKKLILIIGVIIVIGCLAAVIFPSYADVVHRAPHSVVDHVNGENGADFRVDIHDPYVWNASIQNTGNVTLTNIKIIRRIVIENDIKKEIVQEIPILDPGDQRKLITFPPHGEMYTPPYLIITCDQGAEEIIVLSFLFRVHSGYAFEWPVMLLGLILTASGIGGGILAKKIKKLFFLWGIISFIGIFLIMASISAY